MNKNQEGGFVVNSDQKKEIIEALGIGKKSIEKSTDEGLKKVIEKLEGVSCND
jgi:hypothetical protein